MNTTNILTLLKNKIGISHNLRDDYLNAIINSIIKELEDEKGITLEENNINHVMFIVDYAHYRYENKDNNIVMPRNIQYRMHNLMLHNG